MLDNVITFIKESRMELRKVTWPTREETIRYTSAVIGISLALAALLGGVDFVFKGLLTKFVI